MAETTLPHSKAVDAFVDRVEDADIESLDRLILFGSVAERTHRSDSDIDVLAVVADADADAVGERLRYIAYDVMLDYGPAFSIHPVTEETLAHRNNHPFFQRVIEQGQPIYG